MVFFRKNKRQFGIRSHRNLFVAIFLVALFGISGIISLIMSAMAADVPVPSVEILSQNSSYPDGHPGAWRVTKSAEWTDIGKARITFEIDSIAKTDSSKKLDVVMVVDISGSMSGDKLTQVKNDASDLTETLLSSPDNNIALVQFESDARILSGLTNNKAEMLNLIDGLSVAGCTNYYDGLLKAEEVLDGYVQQDDRELVLLFLTDGYPNEQTPNEIAQYQTLKTKYPYMIINGIQYEMGDEVLQPIIDVSDNQFIANRDSLHNVLYEATITPYIYDEFVITDLINEEYWTVAGLAALNATLGDYKLEYDGSTPKITWDLSGLYRTGQSAKLTIEVNLKSEFINMSDLLLPTNDGEEIKTKLPDAPDEDVDSQDSPILKDHYDVIYDDNAPEGCNVTGAVPETTSHTIFTPVEISDNQLQCEGHVFRGWSVYMPVVKIINQDYFIMPEANVTIRALWGEASIAKSMEGTIHRRAKAEFDTGINVNGKMKRLSGQSGANYATANTSIVAIRRSDTLSGTVNTSNSSYILSSPSSELPIYGWYDNGIIYYYTEADDIFMNASSNSFFREMRGLADISGLAYWDASRNKTMDRLFYNASSLSNLEPLRSWDTSAVTTMLYAFTGCSSITSLDPLREWDTSAVKDMGSLFSNGTSIESLEPLSGWNTSNVENMNNMFYSVNKITSVAPLSEWDVSKVKTMSYMFQIATKLTSLDGLEDWDISSLIDARYMFYGTQSLTDISALSEWNISGLQNMSAMFDGAKILSDISPLSGWITDNVTDMSFLFADTIIDDASPLANWNTANVTNMKFLFKGTKLTNINALSGWDTSKVKDISYIFNQGYVLTDISALSSWNNANIENMEGSFYGAYHLADISPLRNWNTSGKLTNLKYTFQGTSIKSTDDLIGWNTVNVVDMSNTFSGTDIVNTNGLSGWETDNVTSMAGMFSSADWLTDISGISGWNTEKVTNMSFMFSSTKIPNVDAMTNWNTSSVTTMSNMFANISTLSNLNGLAGWNTSSLKTTARMFVGDSGLTDISGAGGLDTDLVTEMQEMFSSAPAPIPSSFSSWNVENVTNMRQMFNSGGSINLDPLSSWNTGKVRNMDGMFRNNTALADISGISGWNTAMVTDMSNMFFRNISITSLPLNDWDTSNVTNMTYMFGDIPDTVARPTWYH